MDKDREEARKKFHEMNRKDKTSYVFHYYWPHMLAGVLVISIIIYIIGRFTWNKEPEVCLGVALHATLLDTQAADTLDESFAETFPDICMDGTEQFDIYQFYAGYTSTEDTEQQIAVVYHLAACVAAQQLDVFLGDEDTLLSDVSSGYLMQLTEIFTDEELQVIEEKANSLSSDGSSGILRADYEERDADDNVVSREEDVPYCICVTGMNSDIDNIFANQPTYIAVAINGEHPEAARQFILELLGITF